MALNAAALDAMATGLKTTATHLALHTAAPDSSGSNQAASARMAASWTGPAADGILHAAANLAFTGGAASGACTYVGLWSQLAVGGTFYGAFALTGDQTFNAAGQYTLTSLTVTGTAT